MHCREIRLEFKWSTISPGIIKTTPTSSPNSRIFMKTSLWILFAFDLHGRGRGLLILWVIPEVWCNMTRLVANEELPGLGLADSICRIKID